MKTKTFLIMGAVAIAIFAVAVNVVHAQAASDSVATTTMQHGQFFRRMVGELNLTDDQKSQIKSILRAEKDTLQSLLGQLHDARKNLRAAIQAGDANEASVRAASAKVAGVEADLAVERMKLYGKISPILTDEQRQKISDFTQTIDAFVDDAIARIGDGPAE
jgi:Spy/CpxP family protein refolding chaperone